MPICDPWNSFNCSTALWRVNVDDDTASTQCSAPNIGSKPDYLHIFQPMWNLFPWNPVKFRESICDLANSSVATNAGLRGEIPCFQQLRGLWSRTMILAILSVVFVGLWMTLGIFLEISVLAFREAKRNWLFRSSRWLHASSHDSTKEYRIITCQFPLQHFLWYQEYFWYWCQNNSHSNFF